MDFTETIFLISLLFCLIMFVYKTLNVITFARFAGIEVSIISFIAYFLSFGVAFVVVLFDKGTNLIYNTLFTFVSWLTFAFALLFIAELIINFKSGLVGEQQQYNALERRGR